MKSKEAIRNTILSYTNQIWGTKKIERLDLLVQTMVETLTNELYLVQNKLGDIDATLLEKIAQKLTPEKYTTVRPAHTILQMKSDYSQMKLEQYNLFTLEWLPDGFIDEKAESIVFHPVVNTNLYNIKIDTVFYHKQLYTFDNDCRKHLVANTDDQPGSNSVWLALDIDQEIERLEDLSFYIDFPQLSEIHELYEVLPYTKCFINEANVSLKQGFPTDTKELSDSDKDILHYYNDHYLRISDTLTISELKTEIIPNELKGIIKPEQMANLKPRYWFKLEFSAYFTTNILRDMVIAVNAFPVSNKRLITTNVIRENISKIILLSSEPGEKLLSVGSIVDNRGRNLISDVVAGDNEGGTYHLETINNISIGEHKLIDHIEHLLDLMDDERAVFSEINKDRVTQVLSTLTNISEENYQKKDSNSRNTGEMITRLSLHPYEKTSIVNVDYWVTYGKNLNNIPTGKIFSADKTSKLDGLYATSLCEVHGAKEFSDMQDMMSIDRYIFTSGDRIVTKHNIKCFCESELGRAIEKVEVHLDGKISPKPKEGIVRVIKVDLTPSVGYSDLLDQKGVLRSLKIRLEKRSPNDYNYSINILK